MNRGMGRETRTGGRPLALCGRSAVSSLGMSGRGRGQDRRQFPGPLSPRARGAVRSPHAAYPVLSDVTRSTRPVSRWSRTLTSSCPSETVTLHCLTPIERLEPLEWSGKTRTDSVFDIRALTAPTLPWSNKEYEAAPCRSTGCSTERPATR